MIEVPGRQKDEPIPVSQSVRTIGPVGDIGLRLTLAKSAADVDMRRWGYPVVLLIALILAYYYRLVFLQSFLLGHYALVEYYTMLVVALEQVKQLHWPLVFLRPLTSLIKLIVFGVRLLGLAQPAVLLPVRMHPSIQYTDRCSILICTCIENGFTLCACR